MTPQKGDFSLSTLWSSVKNDLTLSGLGGDMSKPGWIDYDWTRLNMYCHIGEEVDMFLDL